MAAKGGGIIWGGDAAAGNCPCSGGWIHTHTHASCTNGAQLAIKGGGEKDRRRKHQEAKGEWKRDMGWI